MQNIRLTDKFNFFRIALLKNSGILLIASLFILIGVAIIYFNFVHEKSIILYVVGAFVVALPLFGVLFTVPSSFMHYYEQAMTKKYGHYTKATITNKEIEDASYYETVGTVGNAGYRKDWIEQYNHLVTYTYKYKNNTYNNSFYANDNTIFEALKLQSLIPIKFLKTDPKKATVLVKNLTK